jgi:hypothetical protein
MARPEQTRRAIFLPARAARWPAAGQKNAAIAGGVFLIAAGFRYKP